MITYFYWAGIIILAGAIFFGLGMKLKNLLEGKVIIKNCNSMMYQK
jgi:hypothetical protein